MAERKKKILKTREIVFYAITGFIGLVGLVFIVFGIVGDHLPVKASDNWVIISEKAWLSNLSGLGYRFWGIILIVAAAVLSAIVLTVSAREGDRDTERAQRRAQRLAIEAEPLPAETPSEEKTVSEQ